jgi:hypothetical protein
MSAVLSSMRSFLGGKGQASSLTKLGLLCLGAAGVMHLSSTSKLRRQAKSRATTLNKRVLSWWVAGDQKQRMQRWFMKSEDTEYVVIAA